MPRLPPFYATRLEPGEDTTTLAQKLEHYRKYLSIMNTRLGLQILIFDDIAPHLELFEIPKSILLPLVENAIQHGTKRLPCKLKLLNTVDHNHRKTKKTDYSIGVIDNGTKGLISSKRTKALNEKSAQSGHIGLNNVLNRLKLYFDDVEAHVSSIPGYQRDHLHVLNRSRSGCSSGIAALAE